MNDIYNRLNSAPTYHPLSAETFSDWSLEAGDIVTVTRDNTEYSSPVSSSTLKWNGSHKMSISSEGSKEREAVSKSSANKYATGAGGSAGIRNTQYLSWYVYDSYNQMVAGIELTASSAAMYVRDMYNQLDSGIKLTASSAAMYVRDMYNQLESGIELTSSQASMYVRDMYNQLESGIKLTSSSAAMYVRDMYNQLESGIELTSSQASMYVRDMYNQLDSGIKLTSSSAAMYVRDMYNQLDSGIKLTSSRAAMYVRDMYNQLESGIELTSSQASMYVRDMYNQLDSGIKLTASSAAMYVRDMYNQLDSGIKLTSSSAAMYVRDMYNQLDSGIKLTSSSAAMYVRDMYNQLESGIELTSSSAAMYVHDMYNQLQSGIELTSSRASMYVQNMYEQLQSGIELTASQASLYVENLYDQLKAGVEATSSSATLYAKTRTSRAEIIARINANNEGEALINADKVSITGTTTINDVFTFTDGYLLANKSIYVSPGYVFNGDFVGDYYYSQQEQGHSVKYHALVLKKIEVVGNNLKIWKKDDPDATPFINFSKAVTLTGAWSGGSFTVTASPQGKTLTEIITGTSISGTALNQSNNKYIDVTVDVKAKESGESGDGDVVFTSVKTINATAAYNAGSSAVDLDGVWESAIPYTGADNNKVTVSTKNRVNSAGTAANLDRSWRLYVTADGTYAYIRNGSASGTIIARVTHNQYSSGVTRGKAEYKALVRTRFNAASGTYYIEGYENVSGAPGITGSTTSYSMATSGYDAATVVRLQNASGTQISNTPQVSVGYLFTNGKRTGSQAVGMGYYFGNALPYTGGAANSLTAHTTGRINYSDGADDIYNTWTFFVTADNDKAYIRLGSAAGDIVAQTTHGQYTAGFNAGKVTAYVHSIRTRSTSQLPSDASITELTADTYYEIRAGYRDIDGSGNAMGHTAYPTGQRQLYIHTPAQGDQEQHTHSLNITNVRWHSTTGNIYKGKLYYWDDDDQSYEPVYNGNAYWYRSDTRVNGTTTVWY